MATSGSISDPYSGRTQYTLTLSVTRSSTSGTSAKWSWTLKATGSGTSYCLDDWSWNVSVAGQSWSGKHDLDFRGGTTSITIASGTTGWVNQGAGAYTINMSFKHGPDPCSVFGTAQKSGSFSATALATAPSAPAAPTLTVLSPTSIRAAWTAPSNGGSAITGYDVQRNTSASATGATQTSTTALNTTPTGLTQSTTYYFRVRAKNAVGAGAWSPWSNAKTLPASAPGLSVVSSNDGRSATVSLTSPGGVTGVSSYDIEYGPRNGTTSIINTTTTTRVITGLTPGVVYQYRARANFASYTSPWTSWLYVEQKNPSTRPGDYFDGSSTAPVGGDVTYSWTGTVNNSTSLSTAQKPTGWMDFEDGDNVSGGAGAVMSATGGYVGARSAQVTFFADTTTQGFVAGMATAATGRASVLESTPYVGSMWVQVPDRVQRMAAQIVWLNAAGASIGEDVGTSAFIASDTWTRLSVAATAPVGAVYAAVQVLDVGDGGGWGLWHGGDTLLMDAAMLTAGGSFPYFDGDTADDQSFTYDWLGTANASSSQRTTLAPSDVAAEDPLRDPDCVVVPSPPRPPSVPDDCIDDVPLWRRLWIDIPDQAISEWLTEIPTLALTTGDGLVPTDPPGTAPRGVQQVRIRYYPNPFGWDKAEIDPEGYCAEQIISYIPPFTTLTLDGPLQRVFAEVSGGSAIAADHLLYGTGGVPATWPELSCGIDYVLSIDTPLTAPIDNMQPALWLTRRT